MGGFVIKPTDQLLKERGLKKGGKVQKFVDSECVRLMNPYIPFQGGDLANKSFKPGTVIGSGLIVQNISYARKNYYENAGRGKEGTAHGGLRGRKWFERMKPVHLTDILNGAAKIAGARPKRR